MFACIFVSPVVLVLALLVILVIAAGGGAGLAAAITGILIAIASVIGGVIVLGGIGFLATRGMRQRRNDAINFQREQEVLRYEEDREQRRIERQQQRALDQATAMMPVAAVISEAIRAGNGYGTPTADDIAEALLRKRTHAPPVYRAEVLGPDED